MSYLDIPTLILNYHNGCNQAICEIIGRYRNILRNTSYNLLKDFYRVDDVIQELHLELIEIPVNKRKSKFNATKDNVLSFLKRRVKCISIDIYRKSSKRKWIKNK